METFRKPWRKPFRKHKKQTATNGVRRNTSLSDQTGKSFLLTLEMPVKTNGFNKTRHSSTVSKSLASLASLASLTSLATLNFLLTLVMLAKLVSLAWLARLARLREGRSGGLPLGPPPLSLIHI